MRVYDAEEELDGTAKRRSMIDRKLSKVVERESEKDVQEDESSEDGKRPKGRRPTIKFSRAEEMIAIATHTSAVNHKISGPSSAGMPVESSLKKRKTLKNGSQ